MKVKNVTYGFALTLALFIAAAAWIFLLVSPLKRQIRTYKDQLATLDRKIKQDVPESLIQTIEKQADSLSTVMESRRNRIYPMADLIHLGPAMQAMVRKYDLSLIAVKPDYNSLSTLESDTSEITTLPLTFTVKGPYAAFTRFADDLTRLTYAVRADDFFMNKPEKESGALTIEIKGVVFLRKTGVKAAGSEMVSSVAAKKM
jgi:Tfp pilus assembly protein PilO